MPSFPPDLDVAACALASAASAARLLASSELVLFCVFGELPPKVRGGPPILAGTDERSGWGGAEPRTRPGWEKLSLLDLPQMFPIFIEFPFRAVDGGGLLGQ